MKISYIQYDVQRDKYLNFNIIEQHIKQNKADLYVLPELANCGYLFENKIELKNMAEIIPNGQSTLKMIEFSKKYNCTIIFGLAELENNDIYNTACVVSKGNYIDKYRKIHLTDLEKTLFTKGNENKVIKVDNITIGVQICFDIWFPEISREQVLKGAQLICALANFGNETTTNIIKTRAIENLIPVVLCNRIGTEKIKNITADFLGNSFILNKKGEIISKCEQKKECSDSQTINFLPNDTKSNIMCKDFYSEISFHYKNE